MQVFRVNLVNIPLHCIQLKELVSGNVVVAARLAFPLKSVDFLLGNDLAGGKIFAALEFTAVPAIFDGQDELHKTYSKLCAIACVMTEKNAKTDTSGDVNLKNTFVSEIFLKHEMCFVSENTSPVSPSATTHILMSGVWRSSAISVSEQVRSPGDLTS